MSANSAAEHLSDPDARAGGEDGDIAPAAIVVHGSRDKSVGRC
jgi:hypothetical protein